MSTLMEKTRITMLRKFHTICTKMDLPESAKRAMIESYGVTSSRELDAHQLIDLCNKLEGVQSTQLIDADKYRKRLIAAIFSWRKAMGDPK